MKLQTQGKRRCSRRLLIRTNVSDFLLQHSDRSGKTFTVQFHTRFYKKKIKKKEKKNTPKLENCPGIQSLERAARGDASMQRWSGVAGAAEAGSPAAVREKKHSYASGSGVRVGERRAKNLHLSRFPSVRSGRGWTIRCCVYLFFFSSSVPVGLLLFPASVRRGSIFACHARPPPSSLCLSQRT